jgi:hypothetical protein
VRRADKAAVNARWTPTKAEIIFDLRQAREFQYFIRDSTSPAERIRLLIWL